MKTYILIVLILSLIRLIPTVKRSSDTDPENEHLYFISGVVLLLLLIAAIIVMSYFPE